MRAIGLRRRSQQHRGFVVHLPRRHGDGSFLLSTVRHRSIARIATITLHLLATAGAFGSPGPGDPPPDSVGKTRDGEVVQLGAYAGKALVTSFWATWCPYCLKELPILANIQRVAGHDNLQVIAVNTEEPDVFRKVDRALKPLDLLTTRDGSGAARKVYGVSGLPHMVIVGRDGRIVGIYRGYGESQLDDITADLNKAIAAAPLVRADEAADPKPAASSGVP